MIKSIFQGIVIGLASVLPGVSGGTIAISMGIYDKIISCITHLFKNFKKNVLFLLPIGIGVIIAIAGSAFGLDYLFEIFPMQTNWMFIGLILGSVPSIYGKIKGETIKLGHIGALVFFFVGIISFALISGNNGTDVVLNSNMISFIKLLFVGIIASATLIIPGVSGSMLLLMMGYYNPILSVITSFIKNVTRLDIRGAVADIFILAPFGIGIVFGIFALAKLIEMIFKKAPTYAYWGILGLIVASPFGIVLSTSFPELNIIRFVTSFITFVAGIMIATELGDN
ncbi:MAG: DUF368 domain-containing protein [Lachnospiraceae bacterium]|nr:DUF368 domain-containing protein [Lachnospiraceae bacterium]